MQTRDILIVKKLSDYLVLQVFWFLCYFCRYYVGRKALFDNDFKTGK